MFKGKKWFRQKLWVTVTQGIKAVLGWKFWVQDLLHEPEMLPMSPAHLVARIDWVNAKGSKRNRPIPSKPHFLNFSQISRMGLGHV